VSSLFNNKSACKECSNYNKGVIRANKAIKECINNTNINLKNYDYSQIKSIKSKSDEVIIKCIKPDHNWLNITTTIKAHMRAKKGSCSLCNNRFNLENNREYFIEYLNRSNDYNFEYLNLDDVKNQDKDLLTMRCKKHNDEFKITIKRHKKYPSGGCKSCENELRGATRRTTLEVFEEEGRLIHGDSFVYREMVHDEKNQTMCCKLQCKMCNHEFITTKARHIASKIGCAECANNKAYTSSKLKKQLKTIFDKKTNNKLNQLYSYSWLMELPHGVHTKIWIHCNRHNGWITKLAKDHLQGKGCKACAGLEAKTTEQFIEEATLIHDGEYDYAKVIYINNHTKVDIICQYHGVFSQKPNNHLSGQGCFKCFGIVKLDIKTFIERAIKVHGDKYDYSKSVYVNDYTPIIIICKVDGHGEFNQSHNAHFHKSQGCSKCAGNNKKTTEEFITKSNIIHDNKYDYSKSEYLGNKILVEISCPIENHGAFWQRPCDHYRYEGCNSCTNSGYSKAQIKWLDEIAELEGISIRHALNHPRGEKRICGYKVDGFCEETNTVYEYNGNFWHGNPDHYDPNDVNPICGITFGKLYSDTLFKQQKIEGAGYIYKCIWE
jgi:hypothetical protein